MKSLTFRCVPHLLCVSLCISVVLGSDTTTTTTTTAAAETTSTFVLDITTKDFDAHLGSGQWLLLLHAHWCSHCRNFMPVFEKTAKEAASAEPSVKFARIDVAANPLAGRRMKVSGLPAVYFVDSDRKVYFYKGSRSVEALMHFVGKKRWKRQGRELGMMESPFSLVGLAKGKVISLILLVTQLHGDIFMTELGLSWGVAAVATCISVVFGFLFLGVAMSWVVLPSSPVGYPRRQR